MSSKKVAIVTGSAQGIGEAILLRLAKDGYNVVVSDLAVKDSAMEAVARAARTEFKADAKVKACDVSQEQQVKELVNFAVSTFGRLDVMVANAGITMLNSLGELTSDEFNKIMQVNAQGVLFCFKYAAAAMVQGGTAAGGRLLATGSLASKRTIALHGAYCASKFALRALVQVAAHEYGSLGITANAYAPGLIETEMLAKGAKEFGQKAGVPEELFSAQALQMMAVKRLGKPEDVANLVSFLASEQSSFITGQTISIDGGYHMD